MELNELQKNALITDQGEEENLLKDNDSYLNEPYFPEIKIKKKENIFKMCIKLPFISQFLIFIFLLSIGLFIYLIITLLEKPNFYTFDIPWDNFYLNNRLFENYHFDNELEVMLLQDTQFEMDGGAIVINKGYLDKPIDGILTLTIILLNYAFDSPDKTLKLDQYFRRFSSDIDEYFINFRFEILNSGFKKYIGMFASILNPSNFSDYVDTFLNNSNNLDIIYENIFYNYIYNSHFIKYKEKHILEYLVYDIKDENNSDIFTKGNYDEIEYLFYNNPNELKQKIMACYKQLTNPKNIKIVLFSKYKFLISSKYMKKFFQYLINKTTEDSDIENDNDNNISENMELKKSQIISIRTNYFESNYIKIIYFIDKVSNETYSEMHYKKGYFNYIADILSESKEGSLYSLLNNNTDFCIRSLSADYEYILKSKIKFIVSIELNCLRNINEIILIVYQYIHKIINEPFQAERYMELKDLYKQMLNYTEKSYETIELAKNNGKNIFLTKYKQNYYFYRLWCPWEVNLTNEENINITEKEAFLYYNQLKPENSVIILGIKKEEINKIKCKENSFPLNCSFFKDEKNERETYYYNMTYINNTFNVSEFKEYLEINNTIKNISSYKKNIYISKHKEIFKEVNDNSNIVNLTQNSLNHFYFKRNLNICIPKVYISINLLHPYLRPMTDNEDYNSCYYFQIFEIFSAIKRKAYDVLADAIRAGNDMAIYYNENYLYIDIICFEDVAYNMLNEIKKIIFDTDWASNNFITNNEIYKYDTISNFFNFGMDTLFDIGRYYFYCKVKNNLFNKYDFNFTKFDIIYNDFCKKDIKENVKDLNKFIINGLIYGYYNETEASKIDKIFERKDFEEDIKKIQILLERVNNTVNIEDYVYWVNQIKQLKKNDPNNSSTINTELINKNDSNFGIRYITISNDNELNKKYMILSLLYNMIANLKSNIFYFVDIQMFTYRDIYFEIYLEDNEKNKTENPNNDLNMNIMLKEILNEATYKYSQKVDNIGDKFYYLQKNLISVVFKSKFTLVQLGEEEKNYKINNYSEIHPQEIINSDINNKEGKNYKFSDIIDIFNSMSTNPKFDVNTGIPNKKYYKK